LVCHDAAVKPRTGPLLVLLAAALAALLASLAGCASTSSRGHLRYPTVSVTVGKRPVGRPLAPGFLGLSFEYSAVPAYARPATISLIRELSPGERPVLRIGGNSTDEAWWPQPGEIAPRHATEALSGRWLKAAKQLASALDAKLIMGLNLAGGRPGAARDEARAFLRGIGRRYIQAFEIGNEPDLYGLFPWPQDRRTYRRGAQYSLHDYIREFSRWRATIGSQPPIAGPAYATFDWSLGSFLEAEPGLKFVTFHHYALDACLTSPSARGYPTIGRLLSDQASAGLAERLAPVVAAAHAHRALFRLDELNSASCGGKPGVSNTPLSAVWMVDALFNLARVGVDGVNVHTFPGAAYAPFGVNGRAYPEYYGMRMFALAFPPGARLLPVTISLRGPLKAWATVGRDRATRLVLINKSLARAYQVRLRVPGLPRRVHIEGLRGRGRTTAPDSITIPAANAVLVTP
jgi:hypothetical protein